MKLISSEAPHPRNTAKSTAGRRHVAEKIAPGARARPTSAPTLARAGDCLPEPPEGGTSCPTQERGRRPVGWAQAVAHSRHAAVMGPRVSLSPQRSAWSQRCRRPAPPLRAGHVQTAVRASPKRSRRSCLPHTAAARRALKTCEGPRNHAGGPSASRPRGKQTQRQSSMRKETVTAAGEPGHAAARTPPGATAAVASGHIARLLRIVVSTL